MDDATIERRLDAQWAALDRLDLDIFLMSPDTEESAAGRRRLVAISLVAAWSNRISGMDDAQSTAILSGCLRETDDEGLAARMARAARCTHDATAGGSPLAWRSFVLAGDGPWPAAIRGEVLEQIAELEADPDGHDPFRGVLLRSFLWPAEDQVQERCRQDDD